RLLDAVADRCIRQSRRDPRDCAPAEQALYDQIDDALDQCAQGKPVEFLMQTNQWYQHILMPPEEFTAYGERLVGQVVRAMQEMLTALGSREALRVLLLTAAAGRLPGLVLTLQTKFAEQSPSAAPEPSGDFGEDLLPERGQPAGVIVLSADATAQ